MSALAHSSYPPSGFAQMVQCAGSRRFQMNYPELQDPLASLEGQAAHSVCQAALMGHQVTEGMITPNGIPVTSEMMQGAKQYVSSIRYLTDGTGAVSQIERPVSIPDVHRECWGTPDHYVWLTPTLLYVDDYKFGFRPVSAFENWQMTGYASGALSERGNVNPNTLIVMRIHQPRAYHSGQTLRTWKVFAHQLKPYVERLAEAAKASDDPNAPLTTGPACRDCNARHDCPAAQAAGFDAAEFSTSAQPLNMTPDAASLEYRMLSQAADRIKARMSGLEEQLKHWIREGQRPAHVKMSQSKGRTVWNRPASEIVSMAKLMGVDVAKPLEAITPKQAEEIGLDRALIASYSEPRSGEMKLVIDDGTDAHRVFFNPQPTMES